MNENEDFGGLTNRLMPDRMFRVPRLWSNAQLRKIAYLVEGRVANVSAWRDEDKQGNFYKEYFSNSTEYTLTNYDTDKCGIQNAPGEIYLDLEAPLPDLLRRKFDCVFNHTTLEHIYKFETAFHNLCDMSQDLLIIVVPWLQPHHSHYGDYWRFSPHALTRMFEDAGLTVVQMSWNEHRSASVYIFAVATRLPEKWKNHFVYPIHSNHPEFYRLPANFAGVRAFPTEKILSLARKCLRRFG